MTFSEVMGRVLEKWKHHTERYDRHEIKGVFLHDSSAESPPLPSRDLAPALLKQALSDDAKRLTEGQWSLFGWNEVQVSSPPNWHRDYAKGVDVPISRGLNHRDLSSGADVRTIWEINRWAEMVRLAMHAYVNDEAQAVTTAQSWLTDWTAKTPLGEGINWTSALEGGLRLINFCWFDALVAKSKINPQQQAIQRELANAIIPAHVWWVKRYVSFGSSANNHRLGELTGLLLAVKRWPELESIAGTAHELWEQIGRCVLSQFAEDGGNREQALHYHLFAMEMALHAARAMDIKEGPVIERLKKAAEFFVHMAHPKEPWDFGDNDDAQIVPLTLHREQAVAEWSAWLQGHGIALEPSALNFWLNEYRLEAHPVEKRNSYSASGMAVIENAGWKVRLDASPLGFGKMAAHGHCDALHVSIWDGEHALVIDPGTGGYYGMKEQRAILAAWEAHNGPQPLNGFKTPQRMGTFLLSQHHAEPQLTNCDALDATATFEHEGCSFSRSIRTLEDGSVRIEDQSEQVTRFRSCWHLAPEIELEPTTPNKFRLSRDGKQWTLSFVGDDLICSEKSGVASRKYGNFETCVVLEVTSTGRCLSHWSRLNNQPESSH
jgi:hypothetical protein